MEVYVVKLLESPGLKDEFKSESERNKSNKELDLFFPITWTGTSFLPSLSYFLDVHSC